MAGLMGGGRRAATCLFVSGGGDGAFTGNAGAGVIAPNPLQTLCPPRPHPRATPPTRWESPPPPPGAPWIWNINVLILKTRVLSTFFLLNFSNDNKTTVFNTLFMRRHVFHTHVTYSVTYYNLLFLSENILLAYLVHAGKILTSYDTY